jgi:PKD repeat protein
MKKLFSLLFALAFSAGAFAQGFNVEVCATLTGPPLTGPVTATLTYYANNMTNTSTVTINNVALPYQFCFPAYLQMPDSGNYAYASGNIQLSNCGPSSAYYYGQMISSSSTINTTIQNCGGSTFCSVSLSQIPGTTTLSANAAGLPPFIYSWDGGLTYSSNSSFNMSGPGTYCVTTQDASGCTSTDCFNAPSNCAATMNVTGSGPWTLDLSSTGVPPFSYLWSNGATTASIVASTPGNYCATVIDANNCVDSVCFFIQGTNNCGASIIAGNDPAMGDFLTAVPDSNAFMGVTYSWNTGETTSTIYPSISGPYCVYITYPNGCMASACITYTGGNPLVCGVYATAVPDSTNNGFVYFSSFPSGTAPFTYQWFFSNNTTSTLANPYINLNNNTGINWAYLTVTDANGCVSYYSVSVVLPNNNFNCNAYFSMAANYNGGTAGEIFFQDQSFSSGGIASYAWDFGDNTTTNQQNPIHTYSVAGYYNVCLTITGSNGCVSNWCTNVYVDPAWWGSNPFQGNCTAGFLILNNPANSAGMINIINTSQGNYLYYTWDFGNGAVFNTPNPFYAITASGVYPICLTILDSMSGCTDTFCDTITVDSLGNVTRSPLSGNIGIVVYTTAQPNDLLSVANQVANAEEPMTTFPNPSNGVVTLSSNWMEAANLNVEVINLNGQVVYSTQLKVAKGQQQSGLDLSVLANGAYTMKVTTGQTVKVTRLMIQK